MPEMTNAYEWAGRTVVDSDGEKIGTIGEIYEDPATSKPEWATVSSGPVRNQVAILCRWPAPRPAGRTSKST